MRAFWINNIAQCFSALPTELFLKWVTSVFYLLLLYPKLCDFHSYSSRTCYSICFHSHVHTVLSLISEHWSKVDELFKKQRTQLSAPNTGWLTSMAFLYVLLLTPHYLSLWLPYSPGSALGTFPHLKSTSPSVWVSAPSTRLLLEESLFALTAPFFINAYFKCWCTRKECAAMNPALPAEPNTGLSWARLSGRGSFRLHFLTFGTGDSHALLPSVQNQMLTSAHPRCPTSRYQSAKPVSVTPSASDLIAFETGSHSILKHSDFSSETGVFSAYIMLYFNWVF